MGVNHLLRLIYGGGPFTEEHLLRGGAFTEAHTGVGHLLRPIYGGEPFTEAHLWGWTIY